jgi:hypothetical protein
MLKTGIVPKETLAVIRRLMKLKELQDFRLAGETALALHIGHRSSEDIDLFTAHVIDKDSIRNTLHIEFKGKIDFHEFRHGITGFYIYDDKGNTIKIDVLQNPVPFIDEVICMDKIRLASINDIGAMKISAAISRKTKKDYIDISFIIRKRSLKHLLDCFEKHYPYYNKIEAITALSMVHEADYDVMPRLIKPRLWEDFKEDINKELIHFIKTSAGNKKI